MAKKTTKTTKKTTEQKAPEVKATQKKKQEAQTQDTILTPQQAKDWAQKHIPKDPQYILTPNPKGGDDIKVPIHDVVYVTEDKNVFFKMHEGSARNHARKHNLKIFTVKF